MPPKAKAKDKRKAPQTQPTKPESPKPSTKLMSSAILTAKPIKSWYEAVIEEEETTKPQQDETDAVQHWVDTISKSPELLLALQKVSQQTSGDFVSQTGSISKPLSKHQGGISTSKPLLSLQQTSFPKTKSKYIFKTTFQNILTMEEGFYHENPSIAASKIFPPNWYYKPWNLAKPQSYYAAILEITNSVKFKHFKLHFDHTEPAYSTCIIHKILHPKDWGQPLHQPLSFPIHFRTNPQDFNTTYTYWDYQQAWFNAFLLQNPNHSHSWLFYFHNDMNTTNLPLWFLQWWDYYGCHVDYLKDHPLVENDYLHFKNNFQPAPSERKFSSLLIFCIKFFMPWVCSWFYDYNLQNKYPVRVCKFKIKWWDSFAAESKSSKSIVTEWLQKHQTAPIIDHHP